MFAMYSCLSRDSDGQCGEDRERSECEFQREWRRQWDDDELGDFTLEWSESEQRSRDEYRECDVYDSGELQGYFHDEEQQ